jgi:hypothetical protein
MSATVIVEDTHYIITLIRNGVEKKYKFLHDTITLCTKDECNIDPIERQKIQGPSHDDILHFIYADPQADLPEMYIWITEDELWTIDEIVRKNEDSDISFSDDEFDNMSDD